ncbi:MAG: hypothetical protein MUO19_03070 [Dehalococcoidales bacterium]|nr:hypothetical protein [Dehalococcoidales bacterium]
MPATGISLIRPHTEKIKPPRALWVPFQLGHPLGAPDDAAFQRRVLMDVLHLLETTAQPPVLEDFPDDEPENDVITVLACPVNFAKSVEETEEGGDALLTALRREMTALRPWYETSLSQRRRTTVGASGIPVEGLADFIYAYIKGEEPPDLGTGIPLVYVLKNAVEDLKSYYVEGITAQPGQAGASSQVLQDWFWDDTAAGEVLLAVKKVCEASDDKMLSMIGSHFIVPGDVARRKVSTG